MQQKQAVVYVKSNDICIHVCDNNPVNYRRFLNNTLKAADTYYF